MREGRRPETADLEGAEVISTASRTSAFVRPVSGLAGTQGVGTSTVGAPTMAGADEYSAWAERLRQKRVTAKEAYVGDGSAERPSGSNWSTDNVFSYGHRVSPQVPSAHVDPVGLSAAYAVLELEHGAGAEQVDAQYRKLAKRHHPDRFMHLDEATQLEQAEKFRAINLARDVVRQSLGLS